MTDLHLQGEGRALEGFRVAAQEINRLQPDFVIAGGDLIMDAMGVPFERADSLYTLFLKSMQLIKAPVHYVLGNHEVFGIAGISGVSPDHPAYGEKLFLKRFNLPRTYRRFRYSNWHFFLLDGVGYDPQGGQRGYRGYVDSLQMKWIRAQLEEIPTQDPVVIALHIPFYTVFRQLKENSLAGNRPADVINNANEVLALFRGHNLKLVLAGHLHWTEEIKVRGVHFINVGAVSGAWWSGSYLGTPEGFGVFDVKGDTYNWRYHPYGWHAPQKKE
jgi:3',5'-cyclic AMP phosphodiesterase CpdA